MIKEFKITNKHYQILIKQGFDNLPYETGGFVGGKDGVITGILPTFNKDWDQNKDVFKIDDTDMQRAHSFFAKHNIKFFGIYHTHPTGIAYPSDADMFKVPDDFTKVILLSPNALIVIPEILPIAVINPSLIVLELLVDELYE